jgi:hypothetical protein
VIPEAVWPLRRDANAIQQLLNRIDAGLFETLSLTTADAKPILATMKKYRDIRIQLADASVIHLAARDGVDTVFTLDRPDFSVYRLPRDVRFVCCPSMREPALKGIDFPRADTISPKLSFSSGAGFGREPSCVIEEPAVFFWPGSSYSDSVFRLIALMILAFAATAAGQTSRTKITMERKGCPMDLTCAVYKLTLEADGSVLFEGKQRVSAMGAHRRKIQPAAVEELAHRFDAISYFDLPEHLGSCTDAPMVLTSVSLEGRSHQVSDWECGTAPSLKTLEDEIDQASNSEIWVRGRLRLWLHWPWRHS